MEKKIIKKRLRVDRLIVLILVCFVACFSVFKFVQSVSSKEEPEIEVFEYHPKENRPIVVIDPGHGGYDGGTLSLDGTVMEKDITLQIAEKLADILTYHGVDVILTRESDEVSWNSDNEEDLYARLDVAEQNQAEMMVSIHCNAAEFDFEAISGIEVYANPNQENSMNLAQKIQGHLNDTDLNVREMKDGSGYHVMIFNGALPVVLVETGFLTNSSDLAHLTSPYGQGDVALEIAHGILDYLGITYENKN